MQNEAEEEVKKTSYNTTQIPFRQKSNTQVLPCKIFAETS